MKQPEPAILAGGGIEFPPVLDELRFILSTHVKDEDFLKKKSWYRQRIYTVCIATGTKQNLKHTPPSLICKGTAMMSYLKQNLISMKDVSLRKGRALIHASL